MLPRASGQLNLLGLPPCAALIVRKPSVFQEFLARLLRFLLSEVKPGRGDHFSFLARLFHKLAGGAKPRLRLFPNQGIVTTSHLTARHLIPFQPDSLHLDQVGLHLHLVALHPTGCWLHLALTTSWHSLLPLEARSGGRLDKVRGSARGESNPPIILTCLTPSCPLRTPHSPSLSGLSTHACSAELPSCLRPVLLPPLLFEHGSHLFHR